MGSPYTQREQDYSIALEALTHAALMGKPLLDFVGEEAAIEAQNLVSAVDHARKRDTPAKEWWNCPVGNPAVARALKVDSKQYGAFYALLPFRLYHDGEKHVILAAYPCPRVLGPVDVDWLDIETVIAWNPLDDTATVLGDHTPGLFGADLNRLDNPTVFASPRDFFTQWMMDRAAHFANRQQVGKSHWHSLTERDACPGKLAIGSIEKIRWDHLPRDFEARGFDTRKLNNTILRQANLPRAFSNDKRAAA